MKTLATLASDQPGRKRRRGGDDDNFGANDDDWTVYRTVATGEQSDEEEEEDLGAGLKTVESQLLKYDPTFTEQSTREAQSDWNKSMMHAFLRGPRAFNPESQQESHQIHLNVERIRIPEVVFQPAIAGLDQAGIIEITADIINQSLSKPEDRDSVLKDIFLTGGNTMFSNFDERIRKDLRSVLPIDSVVGVRRANDPLLDAWRGAAQWAREPGYKQSAITRDEYLEKGSDFFKVSIPVHAYVTMNGWLPSRITTLATFSTCERQEPRQCWQKNAASPSNVQNISVSSCRCISILR